MPKRVSTGIAPRGGIGHLADAGRVQNHQTDALKLTHKKNSATNARMTRIREHILLNQRLVHSWLISLFGWSGIAFAGADLCSGGQAFCFDLYLAICAVAFIV